MTLSRRRVLATSAAVGMGALAAGCGESNGSDGRLSITYAWWSGPEKDEATKKVIALFEKKHTDITVKPKITPWAGYWDKLATETAGGNPPDVIHMSERYILEYGERGALADLSTFEEIDTDQLEKSTMDLGRGTGEELFALTSGLNTFVLGVNLTLLKKAGLERPDDATWTWDDYRELSKKVADKIDVIGAGYGTGIENCRPWLFQHGETLYTKDGKAAGFSEQEMTDYLDSLMALRDSGGASADQLSEQSGLPLQAGPFATSKQAMTWLYSNQLESYANASKDSEFALLRIPSVTGKAKDAGMYYKGSGFFSISAKSEEKKQKAAATFIDFMLNDPEAVKILGLIDGVPPNTAQLEKISGDLTTVNQHVKEFVTGLKKDLTVKAPGPSPIGSGNVQGIFDREFLDLLYGKQKSSDAAAKIHEEINHELGR